jgi:hypothetical protein
VHFLAHLQSTCGPLAAEAADGSSQVLARTAAQLAMQVGCQCICKHTVRLAVDHSGWECAVSFGVPWLQDQLGARVGQPQRGRPVRSI